MMFEDDEKEFDPSESEEFLKAINDVLDLPEDFEEEAIEIDTSSSQIIDIPDMTSETEPLSDSELEEYDAALAKSLSGFFEEESDDEAVAEEKTEDTQNNLNADEEQNEVIADEPSAPEVDADDIVVIDMDPFEEEFPEENIAGEEDIIDDINAALALQVNEISISNTSQKKSKKWLLSLIPIVGIAFLFTRFREGMPKWLMGIRIAIFSVFAVFLIGTVASGGKLVYNMIAIYSRWRMSGEATTPTPPVQSSGGQEKNPQLNNSPDNSGDNNEIDSPVQPSVNPPRVEEHIVNILLLGEEKIGSENSRGRTDLIMIATLDTEQRTVKLTSIMRDILVAIPGHSDDRINSVYGKGGIELLKEVIELNFEIVPDGYMLVDFDSFEQIINNLDGVTIELSAEEAEYLNTTNYISNPIYRNVVPGLNKMNGNQALGYCRVRHVPTMDNAYADFGRTSRQRVVLNALFEKVKTKNLFQLAIFADSCLPLIETDLSAAQISDYMEKAVESRITSLVQMRIPLDGSFRDATYNGITDLIQINFPENIKALHEFIFGDYQPH